MLDFCRLNTPLAVLPCATVSEMAAGKAWSIGDNELVGGGGGGVVDGGGGGVVDGGGGGVVEGGGGVVDGGGGGGGVVPAAVTVVVTGIRKRVDTPGPDSPMYTTPE